MKHSIKLLIAAVLSLSIGIAFASPLIISDLITPYPRILQGPKAEFSIDTVYANFEVQENASNIVSGDLNLSIVDYVVVLNVTNLYDKPARISNVNFVAAEEVTFVPSLVGGFSVGTHGKSGGGGNGFVEGLWLDDEWLNVTWLPDGQLPDMPYLPFLNENIPKVIPALSAEESLHGQWIEGVHVWEYHNITSTSGEINMTTYDYIFVNGTWVDVTGRVRPDTAKPFVRASGMLLRESLSFDTEDYGSYNNVSEYEQYKENWEANPSKYIGDLHIWAGEGGFDCYWQPGESRLIYLKGTWDVGIGWLEPLKSGKINMYNSVSSYLYTMQEMGDNYANTALTQAAVKQVAVQTTAEGYLYNAILGDNQAFQIDQFGAEVFIKSGS
ncbi:MAG: hypothetical protein NWF05_00410 [Candidatus Bathyarchaeota archaeon]|nr:hypothetical protein [Candidatus Bathyarchaeota archaeon]